MKIVGIAIAVGASVETKAGLLHSSCRKINQLLLWHLKGIHMRTREVAVVQMTPCCTSVH